MRKLLMLILFFTSILNVGCIWKDIEIVYEGERRQLNEVAMIRGVYFAHDTWPDNIDGRETRSAKWYEFPAGEHIVEWTHQLGDHKNSHGKLKFKANAGHVYALKGDSAGDCSIYDITNTTLGNEALNLRKKK